MTDAVLDAPAILALLHQEDGADRVLPYLDGAAGDVDVVVIR